MAEKLEWRIRLIHPLHGDTTLDYVDLDQTPVKGQELKILIDKAEKSFAIVEVNEATAVITVELR
jgi:hypothetical protein